ncbi:MAG: prephenate dehydrogenase [Candidatus Omnitrophica bacterium]|nr:prephenate dehydrogenase [Candidatus Omnitrophota bacterium]
MRNFNKVTIIGVGLMGGSIGLALKKRRMAGEVTGVFRRASTLKKALKHKAVDKASETIEGGVKDADLIILATPVHSIPGLARESLKYAKKGAIITDIGSTKKWIVDSVDKMFGRSKKVFFVGSHPMAGSEHAGVEYAKKDLFKNSPCIVTSTPKTDKKALDKVVKFWRELGLSVAVMSPSEHDRSVSLISHLPHLVAFSLAGAVPVKDLAYAAEGFKDTTRVAMSDPRLWTDIFLSNRKEIVKAGSCFEKYYKKIITAIAKGNYSEVVGLLEKAKTIREHIKK